MIINIMNMIIHCMCIYFEQVSSGVSSLPSFPSQTGSPVSFFLPWRLLKLHDDGDDDDDGDNDDDGDDDDDDDDEEGGDDYDDSMIRWFPSLFLQPPFIPSHEDSVGIAPPAPTPWLLSYLTPQILMTA